MAILLIGSTGSGKSCLGNFLLDPSDEAIFKRQKFKTAKANRPETQIVSKVSFKYEDKTYSIIDTPGLNESNVHDLQHMIQIIEELQKVGNILACVLVVKFDAKIDAQYKETVKYYRKLLPSLFERNVIIVMTNFAMDEKSEMLREKQAINVEEIKRNAIREIVENGSLVYEPPLFSIDCLPVVEEERTLNQNIRAAIFSKLNSQVSFPSSALAVAKTPYLKGEDIKIIKECEGEITGYNNRLQQANKKAAETLEKIQKAEHNVTENEKKLKALNDDLCDKDSSDLTSIGSWTFSDDWKWFRTLSKDFEKTTSCEIDSVDKWTNGHCKWKDLEQTKYSMKGKLEGKFMRGIYAGFILQTSKRKNYATAIESLNRQICEVQKHGESLKKILDEIADRHREYTTDINLLKQFIMNKRMKITAHSSDYMTLEEARARLNFNMNITLAKL